LLPAAAVLIAITVGQVVRAELFSGTPAFKSVEFIRKAPVADFLGLELAARQRMITMTFLLVMATVVLISVAIWVIGRIWAEHSSKNPTNIDKQDLIIGGMAVAAIVSVFALASAFFEIHCGGGNYVYYCLGEKLHPGLLQQFLALADPTINSKYAEGTLQRVVDVSTVAVAVAGAALLAALIVLPRGLESIDSNTSLLIDDLTAWYHDRLNRLGTLSVIAVLVLIVGLAQMSTWLAWPIPLMSKGLLMAGDKVNAGYSDIIKSQLEFHGIWFSIIVAALIIPTKMIIGQKCRAYIGKAAENTLSDKAEVAKLRQEISTGADLKSAFDRYRSYLLILAPPLAQQILQTLPQTS